MTGKRKSRKKKGKGDMRPWPTVRLDDTPHPAAPPSSPRSVSDFHIDPSLFVGTLVTYAMQICEEVGLPSSPPRVAVEKLGLCWEEVEAALPTFKEELAALERGRGRPPKSPDDKMRHPGTKAVMTAVRDYLIDNPGCVAPGETGQRFVYSADFKAFVLRLLDTEGPGHGMTLEQAEFATGVPAYTLAAWRRNTRGTPPQAPE